MRGDGDPKRKLTLGQQGNNTHGSGQIAWPAALLDQRLLGQLSGYNVDPLVYLSLSS